MKILAFSDLHCDLAAAQKIVDASISADVVVGAGDFGAKGKDAADVLELLRAIKVPTILVAGNHDNVEELSIFCDGWTNGHFLHGRSVTIKGQAFFGLGCEIPGRSAFDWNQTMPEAEAAAHLATCPPQAVLVTHTPPFGYADLQRDGSHEGSESILNTISLCDIRLNLCGHIHHAWGTVAKYGMCTVHNLGPTVNWGEI